MATTNVGEGTVSPQWSSRALLIMVPVALAAALSALPELFSFLDGLAVQLAGEGARISLSSLLNFPLGLRLAHLLALLVFVLLARYALDRMGMFLVEDYAVPAGLVAGVVFAWFMESGTLRPSLDVANSWWASRDLFPWATLGALAATAVNMGLRRFHRRPAFLPLSEVAKEKLVLLLGRYKEIGSELLHNKMSLTGAIILLIFALMGIIGPIYLHYSISESLYPDRLPSTIQFSLDPRTWFDSSNWVHPLGTDGLGQDIWVKLVYGTRVSVTIGVIAAIVSSIIGTAVGLISGYVGGWKDEVLMRMNDVVLSLPTLVLLIILAAILQRLDIISIILIIGLTSWSFTARVVRAQVLSVKERMFVERARAIGSGDWHIVVKHVFPNVFPLIFANTILTVSVSILYESTLAFLGFTASDAVSWGSVLNQAFRQSAWSNGLYAWILVPGIFIVLVVLGFSFMGYALDEILNPKLKRR